LEYTTEELPEWKKAQVTDGGGVMVQDDDVADLAAVLKRAKYR